VFSLSHEEIRGRAKSRRAERERERDREREGETTADKRLLTTPHKNRVPRTDIAESWTYHLLVSFGLWGSIPARGIA
jgi:septal ring factor EnvC (AmiA/AmiB activator)